ncbi:MAG: phosphate ABC transporter permease subunit PstC [Gemmatimonadota bacterium]
MSPAGTAADLRARRRLHLQERVVGGLLFTCGAVSILTTVGIVVVLVSESIGFFRQIPILDFLTGTRWAPLYQEQAFGILPLLNGTLMIALGSSLIALPIGLASAIYLSEYATSRTRRILKPILEILAGIPTVVYGYFALTFITPILRSIVPDTGIFNAASAAIVVGVMILPMVSSLSEDALSAVPRALREAAYGIGATKFEVSTRVVVPAALSGIAASFILAISRAVGETVAVYLAAGATPKLTLNFFESIQTMSAYIVQVSLGETPRGTLEYRTIFAVGLVLFLITLAMNILSQRITHRFREVYE